MITSLSCADATSYTAVRHARAAWVVKPQARPVVRALSYPVARNIAQRATAKALAAAFGTRFAVTRSILASAGL